ncbi:MAG: hypothetical protein O3B74_12195 [Proteobacteria bacterium]|nr:hypothetical protein [Pseudomonadota bacterium]MDA1311537.1 hypothetical protein [Pseudomonadota bacterium]
MKNLVESVLNIERWSNRGFAVGALAAMFWAGSTLASHAAEAQSFDLPRTDLVEQLGAQYAESQTAVGVTGKGEVLEVFATGDGSTWTLVLTAPDGTSRIVAAGQTWIKR